MAETESESTQGLMPSEEEVDQFVELYDGEEDLTVRQIANRDDIDWSKSTVSKHLRRRGVLGDDDEDDGDREYTEGVGFKSDDIPEPMDLLLEIMEKDPDLKEKHAEYVLSFEDLYGVIGTSDVGEILRQVKIANKQMVISRVNSRFTKTIQRYLNENPDLVYHEKWRRLIEKETGQDLSHVENQGANLNGIGIGMNVQQGGGGPQQQGQLSLPQQAMPGNGHQPGQQPSQQPHQNGHAQQGPEPRRAPNQNGQVSEPRQEPEPRGGSDVNEKLVGAIESLHDRIDRIEEKVEDEEAAEPSPNQGSFAEIKQFMELQQEMEGLLDGLGESEDVDEEVIEQVREEVDGRLSRVEQMLQETVANNDPAPDPAPDMVENEMMQIAQLAQVVDSEDTLVELAKMQSDPEVMEAQAKAQSEAKDAEWKAKVAENLSPTAIEKGIDAILGMSGALNGGQPQQRQQPQQQPSAQQSQQESREVTVVEAEAEPPEEAGGGEGGTVATDGDLDGSPMRQEAMSEKMDTDEEGSTEDAEAEGEPEGEDTEAGGDGDEE